MESRQHPILGECPRCHYLAPLSGGLLTHHKRLRRGKWLPCPGIATAPAPAPKELPFKEFEMRRLPKDPEDPYTFKEFKSTTIPPITFGRVIDPGPDHDPGEFERNLMRTERGPQVIDRRSSSLPDDDDEAPRYIAAVDPGNPDSSAVIIDRLTGEVVYRRKGVQ